MAGTLERAGQGARGHPHARGMLGERDAPHDRGGGCKRAGGGDGADSLWSAEALCAGVEEEEVLEEVFERNSHVQVFRSADVLVRCESRPVGS